MKVYATGMTFGEGPRWHAGALWASDPQASKLWTDASGDWSARPLESPANGLWFLPDKSLVAAMMHEKRIGIWRHDHFETYVDLADIANGPLGDLTGDAAGNLYVDDVGYLYGREEPRPGRVLFIGRDRSARVAAENVEFPNGLALIDGGRRLVVAQTWAQRLTAFDVGDRGTLHNPRLYADIAAALGADAHPDGIWANADGIWVATLTGHAVVLFRDGLPTRTFHTGDRLAVACCVDDEGSRLFVTVANTAGLSLSKAIAAKRLTAEVAVFDLSFTPESDAHESRITPRSHERATPSRPAERRHR
jgi:sugar lactone lactonase YvrE